MVRSLSHSREMTLLLYHRLTFAPPPAVLESPKSMPSPLCPVILCLYTCSLLTGLRLLLFYSKTAGDGVQNGRGPIVLFKPPSLLRVVVWRVATLGATGRRLPWQYWKLISQTIHEVIRLNYHRRAGCVALV